MRFKVEELRHSVAIEIKGDEPWLSKIYGSFGQKTPGDGPRLTGHLTLTPDNYGAYYLKGDVVYSPFVACGRCEDLIPWEIRRTFAVRFLTPYEDEDGTVEKDLTPEDLDDYYIENKEIDLEPVLNDMIQTSLPTRLIKTTADGKACSICLEDVQTPLVYEQQKAEDASPFAVLKNLKLPE